MLSQNLTTGQMIGPYEVTDAVARGGMAMVYLVKDSRNGQNLALKLLHSMADQGESLTRFRMEFKALSQLKHPNILKVYDWGVLDEIPWYTMEHLDGCDLKAVIVTMGALPLPERFEHTREFLIQIAKALSYIHARGLVHRDVTPANIMVSPTGHLTLMDFGVVKKMGRSELTSIGEIIGTFAYTSPEQIASKPVDARSDLYSLGVILYQLLTDKRPFYARNLKRYLQLHLEVAPRPVLEVQPLAPKNLATICHRLLEKDPGKRFTSAAHLLHALGEVVESETSKSWPPTAFVGRTQPRVRIQQVIDNIAIGNAGKALVFSSAEGFGKSYLLTHIQRVANRQGLKVCRVKAHTHDRPFGPFAECYKTLRTDKLFHQHLNQWIDDQEPTHKERYPFLNAYKDWLLNIGPVAILIDDFDLADPATVELLEYLIRNTIELESAPILFAISENTDSKDQHTRVFEVPIERFSLGPISATEVEELLLSSLASDHCAEELATRIHAECNGSPSLISDMLKALHDEGIIHTNTDDELTIAILPEEVETARLPLPSSIQSAINERLSTLSASALSLGALLAISHRGLELDAITTLTGLDELEVMDAIDSLEDADVVVESLTHTPPRIDIAHQRFRDPLKAHIKGGLKEHHRNLAEYLERAHRQNLNIHAGDLANHFEAAGIASKAFHYMLRAARNNIEQSLYQRGLTYLDRALAMEDEVRHILPLYQIDKQGVELHLLRSEAVNSLGDIEGAIHSAKEALALATEMQDLSLMSRAHATIGDQYRGIGELPMARTHLTEALDLANKVGDDQLRILPTYRLGSVAWAMGDLETPKLLWNKSLKLALAIGDERALGFCYNGLGLLAICEGRSMEARAHIEKASVRFEKLGMIGPLTVTRVNLVELNTSIGVLNKALKIADKTVAAAGEAGHQSGIAKGLFYRAEVLMAIGQLDQAFDNASEASKIAKSLGSTEELVKAEATLIRIDLDLSNPQSAIERHQRLKPMLKGLVIEGVSARAVAQYAEALALSGETKKALKVLELPVDAEPMWPHVQVRNELARGRARAAIGQQDRAVANFNRALSLASNCSFRFYQLVANHLLVGAVSDDAARSRHRQLRGALAQSLAASLSQESADRFCKTWDRDPE